ncbi:MAG: cell division protein ZapA [Oscillospiraceae bacterium]|nr:cell division protein ZapA [Oscillospiraceae bacterium]
MAVNRVTLTINSRQYTVVAEESTEYIERLCNHINEKVENVIRGGQNLIGERPVVLAALNICDEYFKTIEASELIKAQMQKTTDKNLKLQQTVKNLNKELDEAKSAQISIDETAMKAEVASAKNELDEANNQIKFLEGHIKSLENKISELEKKYDEREKEVLEMIEKG